jgi:hypothetical protein
MFTNKIHNVICKIDKEEYFLNNYCKEVDKWLLK